MTKQVQRRRGSASQHTSFTGAEGELSVNTTNKSVHVHDGSTAGGIEAARADLDNVSAADIASGISGGTVGALTITSADINGGTIDGVTIGGTTAAAITGTTITASTGFTGDVTGNVTGNVTGDVTGNLDGIVGGTTPAAGTFTNLTSTGTSTHATVDINGGTIDGVTIGGTTAGAGTFTTLSTSGAVTVGGDLTVNGTTTTINSTTLTVDDLNVVLASGAADAAAANGAGLTVDGASATFTYASTGDKWTMNKDLDVTGGATFSGDLTVDTNTLVVDSANNRVGIGTDSPSAKTEIAGGSNSTYLIAGGDDGSNGRALTFTSSASAAFNGAVHTINAPSSQGAIAFATYSTPRMTIDSSGRVGVGTTSPATNSKLHVNDPSNTFTYSKYTNSTTGTGNADGLTVGISSANALIYNYESGNIQFATAGTERVRIDSDGRLLQGDNFSPLNPNTTIQSRKSSGNNYVYIASLDLGASEQVFVSASGYYNGLSYSSTLASYRNGTNPPSSYLFLVNRNRIGYYHWIDTSGVLRLSTTSSNIGSTSGVVVGTQTSDERLKTIEANFEYGIDAVKQLVPIAYKFNNDDTEQRRLGFGAQTTQGIVPEAVYDSEECIDGYDDDPEDDMVKIPRSDDTKMMMDSVQLIPVLTKALQEAIAKIETLEEKVAALENA